MKSTGDEDVYMYVQGGRVRGNWDLVKSKMKLPFEVRVRGDLETCLPSDVL